MIFERIRVDAFGALSDFEIPDLGEGLTILHGPNEAGKSTLLSFVRFVLFGFRRQDPRYVPPSGSRHGGRIVLSDASGSRYTLERMAQRPLTVRADDGAEVGETALRRMLGQVDENLYRSVFAFSLSELSDFSSLSGEEVERRLFSGTISGAGRNASRAVQELQRRKEQLIRPRSREAVVNALLQQLDDAEASLRRAQTEAESYARLGDEETEIRREQALWEERRIAALTEKHFYQGLHELWEPWVRYVEAREALEALGEPRALPPADEAALKEVDTALSEATEATSTLARRRDDAEFRLSRVEVQPALEAVAGSLQALSGDLSMQRERLALLPELDVKISGAERAIAIGIRDSGFGEAAVTHLDAAVQHHLEDAAGRIGQISQRIEDLERRLPEDELQFTQARTLEKEAETGPSSRLAELEAAIRMSDAVRHDSFRMQQGLFLALAMVAAGVTGAWLRIWPLAVVGLVGIGWLGYLYFGPLRLRVASARKDVDESLVRAGLLAGASDAHVEKEIAYLRLQGAEANPETARVLRRQAEERLELTRGSIAQFKEQRHVVEDEVRQYLKERELGTHLRTLQALQAVVDLRQGLQDLWELQEERRQVQARAVEWQDKAREVLEASGDTLQHAPEEYPHAVEGLVPRVQSAAVARADHERIAKELRAIEAELAEAQRAVEEWKTGRQETFSRLGIADAAEWQSRRLHLEAYRAAADEARQRIAPVELRLRDARVQAALESGSPDAWNAQAEIASDAERRAAEAHEASIRHLTEVQQRRGSLLGSAEVPELEADVESLRTEIQRALGQYLEAALAKRLIEETLDQYIRTQQPEVLRLGSQVFTDITGGRYPRVAQSSDGLLVETMAGSQVKPSELSRGTAEQLYLSIRLGLAATYMDGGIALPLVMDDVLVNFDPMRTERTLQALGRYAEGSGRQVLLFTCHPTTRDLGLAVAPKARAVELDLLSARAEAAATKFEETESPLLAMVRSRPGQTLKEISQQLGQDVSVVRQELLLLVGSGLVRQEGRGRSVRFRPAAHDA